MLTREEFDDGKVGNLLKAGKLEEASVYRDDCIKSAEGDPAKQAEIAAKYAEISTAMGLTQTPQLPQLEQQVILPGSVGEVQGEVRKLEPIQRAGLYLAVGVGSVIAMVTLVVIVKWIYSSPWTGVPSGLDHMPKEQAQILIENIKSLSEAATRRSIDVFDAIVVKALLPVFTSILGYIFGTRTLTNKSAGDTE